MLAGHKMAGATGEAERGGLRVDFDARLKLEFHGSRVTSDAGLLAFRELDDALGLSELAGQALADLRTGRNGRHSLIAQFRQSVFGRLAGMAASASQMGRFETSVLARADNRAALADLCGQWIDVVRRRRPTNVVVLDMDSSVSPVYGE